MRIGDKAVDFDLPGVDGKRYSLASFSDRKAVVVFFSCNHCPYVKAWEDRLVAIQRDYAAKGATLVAINANDDRAFPEDSFEKMVERAKEKGFNFPYLSDESQNIARAYGAHFTPEVFLFDPDRVLRYHGRVDDNHEDASGVTSHDLRNALEAVLAGKPVPNPETPAKGCTIKWKV